MRPGRRGNPRTYDLQKMTCKNQHQDDRYDRNGKCPVSARAGASSSGKIPPFDTALFSARQSGAVKMTEVKNVPFSSGNHALPVHPGRECHENTKRTVHPCMFRVGDNHNTIPMEGLPQYRRPPGGGGRGLADHGWGRHPPTPWDYGHPLFST